MVAPTATGRSIFWCGLVIWVRNCSRWRSDLHSSTVVILPATLRSAMYSRAGCRKSSQSLPRPYSPISTRLESDSSRFNLPSNRALATVFTVSLSRLSEVGVRGRLFLAWESFKPADHIFGVKSSMSAECAMEAQDTRIAIALDGRAAYAHDFRGFGTTQVCLHNCLRKGRVGNVLPEGLTV